MIIFEIVNIYFLDSQAYFVKSLHCHNTSIMAPYAIWVKDLVSKGTVVLRRWENKKKVTFPTKQVDKSSISP